MAKTNKGRKFFATTASAALVASAIVPVASAAQVNDFNSIASYAQEAVQDLVDRGVVTGDTNGNFQPRKSVSRAEAATILTGALGLDTSAQVNFTDVKAGAWYYDAINAAVNNGVFSGKGEGKFDPNGNLTRGEAAVILVNAFGLTGSAPLAQFADEKSVKAWAVEALEIAVGNGVILGDNGKIKANDAITKQDFAVMFSRAEAASDLVSASTVKAINATTVEVTFDNAIEDIKALDFAIEGLEVKNAVVKQTASNTAVLTTEAQEGGKEYTVTVNGESVGKFTGVAAVVPTKVEFVSSSVQGKLGQQVTVQAKVTVAEGQSAAGIPVTFYVPGNNDAVLPTITGESLTDANGVATYTYTRYNATTDQVTAYATGDRSKFATSFAFWGVDTILAVEEVTEGASINNGANKTYKVTHKNAATGKPQAGVTFNVSFLENVNVTADKLQNATVNGVKVAQLSNGTAPLAAQITTDSKGEATFTVSGVNTEVTPVVFKANNTTTTTGAVTAYDYKHDASDLQTVASKVKFSAIQAEYTIEITRDGAETAARFATNGRKYNVVVKDKNGNVAKNELVNVAFNEDLDRVIATTTEAKFVSVAADGTQTYRTGTQEKQITVTTNAKGEASFVISSDKLNDYATPVAWIDVNTPNAVEGNLDEGEPKTVAPISYFVNAYLDGAALKSYRGTTVTTSFNGGETAVFKAALVNQSGKTIAGTQIKKVTYTIFNTGASDVVVGTQVISPNRSYTVTYDAPTSTDLLVTPVEDKGAAVKVLATGIAIDTDGKDYAFTAQEASATFAGSKVVGDLYTGVVDSWNTTDKEITFVGKDAISYVGEGFVYRGIGNTPIATAADFIKELQDAAGAVTVTYEVKDGVTTFYIINIASSSASSVLEKVNASTSAAQVTTALTGYAPFEKLTEANKATVAGTIYGILTSGPLTTAQLNAEIEALIVADVTAVYIAGTAAVAGEKATGIYTDATDSDLSLEIESLAGATEYNDVKVVFANNADTAVNTVTTSYASNVLTVLLPVDTYNSVTNEVIAYDTNATITNVLTAITNFNVAGDLTATAGTSLTDVEDLLDIEITLSGATASTAAVDGKLTLTFSEALTVTTFNDFTITGTGTPAITAGQSTAVVSADNKTVTITIGGTDSVTAGDTITDFGDYVTAGTLPASVVITTP